MPQAVRRFEPRPLTPSYQKGSLTIRNLQDGTTQLRVYGAGRESFESLVVLFDHGAVVGAASRLKLSGFTSPSGESTFASDSIEGGFHKATNTWRFIHQFHRKSVHASWVNEADLVIVHGDGKVVTEDYGGELRFLARILVPTALVVIGIILGAFACHTLMTL